MEIWFWIATGQISFIFDRIICPPHNSGTEYYHFTFLFLMKTFSGSGKTILLSTQNMFTFVE